MKGIFLLGTDTAVGKTTLACGLLHLARNRAFPLIPFKPAETGCDPHPSDARRLLEASGLPHLTVDDICPYALRTPVAPSVAARLDGRAIDPQLLLRRALALGTGGQSLLLEGAGGVLTPYGPGVTGATLAGLFDLDVLLVSANRLGTINQTLLALTALDHYNLRCAGIVLVNVAAIDGPDARTNATEIESMSGRKPLGVLRFVSEPTPEALGSAARADLDLSTLLGGALQQDR